MRLNKLLKIITATLISTQLFSFTPALATDTTTLLQSGAMINFTNPEKLEVQINSLDDIEAVADFMLKCIESRQTSVEFEIKGSPSSSEILEKFEQAWYRAITKDYYTMDKANITYGCRSYSNGRRVGVINFKYNWTETQEKEMLSEIDAILVKIVKPNMSDLDKEKAIHDWIVDNISYDYTSYNAVLAGTIDGTDGNVYTAFKTRKAVCHGYTMLTKLMLNKAGIPCIVVSGTADNNIRVANHAWNMVYVDNQWNYLDVTWNDQGDGKAPRYDYFNCTTQKIVSNHTWDKTQYPIVNK